MKTLLSQTMLAYPLVEDSACNLHGTLGLAGDVPTALQATCITINFASDGAAILWESGRKYRVTITAEEES
jgi:hypothetical protein